MEVSKPGYFTLDVAADHRRSEFDTNNEVLLHNKVSIDYVFFGDSITQGWELPAYFGTSGRLVINRGIGGDITKYAAIRFYADTIQLNPRACISLIGINDAWDLEFDNWRQKEGLPLDTVLATAVGNHTDLLEQAKKHRLKMFVCSVLPTDMQFTNHERERNEYVIKLNESLRELCSKYAAVYVDYHSALVQQDGHTLRMGLTTEGLHPNVHGYNIMAEVLRKAMFKEGFKL